MLPACSYLITRAGSSRQQLRRTIQESQEDVMQMAITFIAVVAGMVFSLAIALLAEELIFGQVFRLFFARQTAEVRSDEKHSTE